MRESFEDVSWFEDDIELWNCERGDFGKAGVAGIEAAGMRIGQPYMRNAPSLIFFQFFTDCAQAVVQ